MSPGQGASALLEEGNVAKPAAVGSPLVLEPHGGRESLLHRIEARHLAFDLDRLGNEARGAQDALHARLVIGEARDLARFPPLVDVERDHAQALARRERPPRSFHDGIGGTEVRGDELWLPGGVLLALDVRLVKLEIADHRRRGEPARLADRARVAIEADGVLDPGREPAGESARSAA